MSSIKTTVALVQKVVIILLVLIILPLGSKAQYISFSSFKKLQQANYSDIGSYFVSNNWTLKEAEEAEGTSLKYIVFEKGDASGAAIKISFDEENSYRGNLIHYFTLNKELYSKIMLEVKSSSNWKKDEPVIKNGAFLMCYTDGNNAILLGPMTKDGMTVYNITMVSWVEYYSGDKYLGKDLGPK